jgi:hypothetical protein
MGKISLLFLGLWTISYCAVVNGMDLGDMSEDMTEDLTDDYIVLRSNDEQEFKVSVAVANQSAVLKLIIDGTGLAGPIPISDLNSFTLLQVISYLKTMAKKESLDLSELPSSDVQKIAQAADLLEIGPLHETAVAQLNTWRQPSKRQSMGTPLALRTKVSGGISKLFDK